MPVKKAAPAKKPIVKTSAKAAPSKRVAKGDSYLCGVCGLAVTVDEACGCTEVCDIVCCGKPMKAQKPKAKVKTAK